MRLFDDDGERVLAAVVGVTYSALGTLRVTEDEVLAALVVAAPLIVEEAARDEAWVDAHRGDDKAVLDVSSSDGWRLDVIRRELGEQA